MRTKLKFLVDILSALLIVVVAAALLQRAYLSHMVAAAPAATVPATGQKSAVGQVISAGRITNVRGGGRVALIEFSDYQCPFCGRHVKATEPMLLKQYIERGQIRHVVFNYPLEFHSQARKASEAAECAARQGRFWEMHDSLFAAQDKLDIDSLLARGTTVTPNGALFTACLTAGATAARVQADIDEGRRLGVTATPIFFVGRVRDDGSIDLSARLDGAYPFEEFDQAIQKLLKE